MGIHVVAFLARNENKDDMEIRVVAFLANIENKGEKGNMCGSIPCEH